MRAMKTSILLMSIILLSPITAFCGDDAKVYSDGDLEQYSYGGNVYIAAETRLNSESNWKQKDFQKAKKELEETERTIREAKDEKTRQEAQEERIKLQQIIAEQEGKKQEKQERRARVQRGVD